MDVLLSKKSALKRRASLSLLFGTQKPTFAALDDKPTRYYDFVDTPAPRKPSSPFIDRQDIDPELESKIKYACSLLAYRIEQGVPSPPKNQVQRRTTRTGLREYPPPEAQMDSKYPSSKMGAQTGYDSGIGLTQQPSMQTMRVLHSRSGEVSESGDTRTVSIFSSSNTRTGTSCSNTSAVNSTTQSPKQNGNELQSMTGEDVLAYAQHQDCDTKAFLTESSQPLSSHPVSVKASGDSSVITNSVVEVFLNQDTTTTTNLSSETLSSHPSPSLGLSRVPAHQHQPSNLRDSYQAQEEEQAEDSNIVGLGATCTSNQTKHGRSRSIIIDSQGRPRLLTPDEESQRNKALQQAVLAKMTPGLMKYNPVPIRQPSQHMKKETITPAVQGGDDNGHERRSRFSQLGLLRSSKHSTGISTSIANENGNARGSKRNIRALMRKFRPLPKDSGSCLQSQKSGASVLKSIERFFSRERTTFSPA
ncbi:hypothetical protein BJX64DRAFT_44734 [Aspergillus heterothallicus]